jgi:hypothetical protein
MQCMQTPTSSEWSRRAFAERTIHSFLAISLIEHLCNSSILAADAKPTAVQWLNEINQLGYDLKGGKLKEVAWQEQVEKLLSSRIDLPEVLKFIDFDAIEKKTAFVDNGARSMRFDYPKIEGVPEKLVFGQQIFALKQGRSVVPHGHNNMATAFLILKGNFQGRLYDRVRDEGKHMIIKPTIDAKFGPGSASSISDVKDNVHWFKAEDESAYIFNMHVLGVNPKSPNRTGRVYVDPAGEKIDGGLIRARILDDAEAHRIYG